MDSKFKVDNSFWDIFPEASTSVLTIKGIGKWTSFFVCSINK